MGKGGPFTIVTGPDGSERWFNRKGEQVFRPRGAITPPHTEDVARPVELLSEAGFDRDEQRWRSERQKLDASMDNQTFVGLLTDTHCDLDDEQIAHFSRELKRDDSND